MPQYDGRKQSLWTQILTFAIRWWWHSFFGLTWKMLACVMISVRLAGWPSVRMWQKLLCCDFLRHCKYGKCQTVQMIAVDKYSLSFTHLYHFTFQWALLYFKVTPVSDVLLEHVIFLSNEVEAVWLLIMSSRAGIYYYFWFLHMFKEDNWHIMFEKNPSTLLFSHTLLK